MLSKKKSAMGFHESAWMIKLVIDQFSAELHWLRQVAAELRGVAPAANPAHVEQECLARQFSAHRFQGSAFSTYTAEVEEKNGDSLKTLFIHRVFCFLSAVCRREIEHRPGPDPRGYGISCQ